MRFLCDVHITIKLSKRLQELGHQSEHVNNILDQWHTLDEDIIKYVDAHQGILVTKDQDFRNRYILNKTPQKLIKINLGNISNEVLMNVVEKHIELISEVNKKHKTYMIEINGMSHWTVSS
jgi:predicted nuclease of predicted toxin-antitoxin system